MSQQKSELSLSASLSDMENSVQAMKKQATESTFNLARLNGAARFYAFLEQRLTPSVFGEVTDAYENYQRFQSKIL